jgi:hypothetical protein
LRAEKWSGCTWLIHLKIDKLTLNTAFIKKTTQLERAVARRQILRKSLKKKKQHLFKIEIISLLTMKLQKFEGYRTRKKFPLPPKCYKDKCQAVADKFKKMCESNPVECQEVKPFIIST